MDRVLVAVPTTGTVEIEYVTSILGLARLEPKADIVHLSGSLVYDARNNFVRKAIEQNYSHVLFVDSDMVFNPDALHKLMTHNKDIVGANYYTRVRPYRSCVYERLGIQDGVVYHKTVTDIKQGLHECEGIGTAFLLIKTQVFKDIMNKFKCKPFEPSIGCGEDLAFCIRARECGYKVFADHDLTVGHIGKTLVTGF